MTMNLKMPKKDLIILIYIAGIVVAVLVYFLYFSPRLAANDETSSEIMTLQSQYSELSALKAKQSDFNTKIASDNSAVDEMVKEFPANIQAEDQIIYTKKLESDYGVSISSVGLSEPTAVYSLATGTGTNETTGTNTQQTTETTASTSTESDAAAAATESGTTVTGTLGGDTATQAASSAANAVSSASGTKDTGVLYSTTLNITFTSDYDGFKKILDAAANNSAKQSIQSATATFDSTTGNLMGTLVINQFFMTGTNQTYSTPDLSGVPSGTTNIFGTVTPVTTDDQTAEATAPAESTTS